VLGPSGAGKSTLFRVLVGEAAPDAGTVELHGVPVTSWPLWQRARAGVGYVPQGPSVLWDLTVRENLVAFRTIARLPPRTPAGPPPAWGWRSSWRCGQASCRAGSGDGSSWPGR